MDAGGTGTPWDFYLAFIERESGLIGRVQYNPSLLDQTQVDAALRDLWFVLDFASSNPHRRLSDLRLRP